MAFDVMRNGNAALVPVAVRTTTSPSATPDGTVVTMKVSVQSAALAIVVVNSPPAPSENTTTAVPWESPNDSPSMMTVLPALPEGFVALLMN